jgi:hypothetical protein
LIGAVFSVGHPTQKRYPHHHPRYPHKNNPTRNGGHIVDNDFAFVDNAKPLQTVTNSFAPTLDSARKSFTIDTSTTNGALYEIQNNRLV